MSNPTSADCGGVKAQPLKLVQPCKEFQPGIGHLAVFKVQLLELAHPFEILKPSAGDFRVPQPTEPEGSLVP